jgi:integrase
MTLLFSGYSYPITIPILKGNNAREFRIAKKHWTNFYNNLLIFLHEERRVFDNYTGLIIKTLRTFLNWLQEVKGFSIGVFHKKLVVRKEEIPVVTFSQEQLKVLMFNQNFENSLSESLRKSKDLLVLGCLTALRFSDLQSLKKSDFIFRDGTNYISCVSRKTGTRILMRLHEIAVKIIANQNVKGKSLCQQISLVNFNKNIKLIAEKAGWTYKVEKLRTIRGKLPHRIVHKKIGIFRFCDLISSHIMRRTAITNLLMLGVSEMTVRKISGHSNSSTSFMKYVNLVQSYLDNELDIAYRNMKG